LGDRKACGGVLKTGGAETGGGGAEGVGLVGVEVVVTVGAGSDVTVLTRVVNVGLVVP
jgi:hypothetical protein